MKILILSFFLISQSFAYEKVFIATHGGKKDPLISKKSSFSDMLGLTLKKEKKTIKSNRIKIDKIEKIEKFNKDKK